MGFDPTVKGAARLSVELDPDLKAQLDEMVPWGTMRPLTHALFASVVDLLKNKDKRPLILGLLLTGQLRVKFEYKEDDDLGTTEVERNAAVGS